MRNVSLSVGWSVIAFHVTAPTIVFWIENVVEQGPNVLVQLREHHSRRLTCIAAEGHEPDSVQVADQRFFSCGRPQRTPTRYRLLYWLLQQERSLTYDVDRLAETVRRAIMEQELSTDLCKLAGARIYFGHHSVGGNILRGLELIARDAGVETINLVQLGCGPAPTLPDRFFAHSPVGMNQDPKGKVDEFVKRVRTGIPHPLDVAFMKFCYVDVSPDTDVSELFQYYCANINRLTREFARVRFLHATVPLHARTLGVKDRIKLLLDRPLWEDGANQRRHEFNELLLYEFETSRVIDIARVESTKLDGTVEQFGLDGHRYPSLCCAYSGDGGHLNEIGQRRVAAELIRVVSQNL